MLLLLLSCFIYHAQSADLQEDYTDPYKTAPKNISLKFLALRSVLTQSESYKTVKTKLDLYHYISNNTIPSTELRLAQYPENIRKSLNFLDADRERQYIFLYKNFLFFKKSDASKNYLAVFDTKIDSCAVAHYMCENFEVKILEKATITEFLPNCIVILCTTTNKQNGKYSNLIIKYSLTRSAIESISPISTEAKLNAVELGNKINMSGLKFKNLPKLNTTSTELNQEELLRHLKKSIDIQSKYDFEMHYPKTIKEHFKKTIAISPWQQSFGSIQFNNPAKLNIHADTTMDID